jgi:methionine synthase II (cobalamin-independent)
MKYTTEKLDGIAAKLREMPQVEKKKEEHTKQDAIKLLSKEIAIMQKRGYTLGQISEALRGEGLAITTPTLKSYLQRAKPPRKATAQAPQDTPPARPKKAEAPSFHPNSDSDDI